MVTITITSSTVGFENTCYCYCFWYYYILCCQYKSFTTSELYFYFDAITGSGSLLHHFKNWLTNQNVTVWNPRCSNKIVNQISQKQCWDNGSNAIKYISFVFCKSLGTNTSAKWRKGKCTENISCHRFFPVTDITCHTQIRAGSWSRT